MTKNKSNREEAKSDLKLAIHTIFKFIKMIYKFFFLQLNISHNRFQLS